MVIKMDDKFLILIYFILFLILIKFSPFVFGAVIIGFYFSIVIDVPAKLLSKKLNKNLSKVISYTLMLSLIFYSFITFIPVILEEGKKIFSELSKISINGNPQLPSWILDFLNNSNKQISNFALNVLNQLFSYTPSIITMGILIIVTTLAVSNLKAYLKKNLKSFFVYNPEKGYNFFRSFYKDFERFVSGQVLVALFVGISVGFLCFVFGIKGALFLGILSFITDFIPFLGVIIVSIPMLMLGWTSKGFTGIVLGIIILVIVNQLESWFFAPKIQSSNLKIHWFVLIIILLIFNDFFGFIGILIAIPTILFIKKFWKYYILGGSYGNNRGKV